MELGTHPAARKEGHSLKVLAVCGMGIGTALILRMQVEKALQRLNVAAEVELADVSTARALAMDADIIVTSAELAEQLGSVPGKIVTIKNYVDVNEMTEKLQAAIGEQG